ncbi:hypothetical protein EDF56_11626 [Novosphingobium sp. PhB165]|uniref:hypothetical protein n=1 Tax=Novosphingobium sp. PhB165 TaxID=2485105 RepID=UPI0010537CF9|nr:hypothetical protein [Novosphingobium sp. PhB165]TCM13002.1 hypothetical protein EDF56_11626 [Novosphingobium sp. PhB165]
MFEYPLDFVLDIAARLGRPDVVDVPEEIGYIFRCGRRACTIDAAHFGNLGTQRLPDFLWLVVSGIEEVNRGLGRIGADKDLLDVATTQGISFEA